MHAHIEPGQAIRGFLQPTLLLASRASLEPVYGPDPIPRLLHPKKVFLVVQGWCHIMAQEGEEAGDDKSLVTVA